MSPFHHHLQRKGWPESKITVRLWIVAFILAIVGLSTLKVR
jgi:phospho-N-acetylmuramoyl-pentapeptide-transferase